MNIKPGHGLLIRIPFFADGGSCNTARTFLVIDADDSNKQITLLNISSVRGKTHKILLPSNALITKHFPPFDQPSFVKMDSIYILEYFPQLDSRLLAASQTLDETELNGVIKKAASFKVLMPI